MHIPGGYRPDQSLIVSFPDRECDEEWPAVQISANGHTPIFVGGVCRIGRDTRSAP